MKSAFIFFSNIFFIFGMAVYFLDDVLYQFLPENITTLLINNKILIIMFGADLLLISLAIFVFAKLRASRSPARLKNALTTLNNTRLPFTNEYYTRHRKGGISADIIDWHHISSMSSTFTTHTLTTIDNQRMISKQTIGLLIFPIVFGMVGLALFISGIFNLVKGDIEMAVTLGLFGICFGSFSLAFCLFSTRKVFDKSLGYYWSGKQSLDNVSDILQQKEYTKLSEITALQVLSRRVSDSDGNYISYEVNLVLADLSRINVLSHGGKENLEADARQLSAFLGVPLFQR